QLAFARGTGIALVSRIPLVVGAHRAQCSRVSRQAMADRGGPSMTSMLTLTSRGERVPDGLHGPNGSPVEGASHREQAAPAHWAEPGTPHCYPLPYGAYRRTREAQEKPPARHRSLGPDIDHYLWRHRQLVDDVDV